MTRLGLGVVLLATGGCSLVSQLFTTPDSAKIATYANEYWYWSGLYTDKCSGEHSPLPCDAAYVALLKTKADIEKANDALNRGGKLPLQMARVRADLKATAAAVGGL